MPVEPTLSVDQAALRFQAAFLRVLSDGVGRGSAWTPAAFRTALKTVGCDVALESVQAWFEETPDGRPVPAKQKFEAILKVLFPSCEGWDDLKVAWNEYCKVRWPRRDAGRSIAAGSVAPVWVAEPVVQVEGLVDLIVNQPVSNNNPDEPYLRLPGTIVIDGGFTRPHEGRTGHIGVTEVVLSLEAPGNAPLPNKRFQHAFDNLGGKPASGGVRVSQPRHPGGWMDGELVGDGTIAFLEASGEAEKPIAVRVLAENNHFVVNDVTDGKVPRQKVLGDRKQAVVGAIIRLGREVDGQDRVAIGRARLVRRKGE